MSRRRGLQLLLIAFVLRVLHRAALIEFAEPYQGRSGLPEVVESWFEAGLPIALEVLFLAAVVAGSVLLVSPVLQRQLGRRLPADHEQSDA